MKRSTCHNQSFEYISIAQCKVSAGAMSLLLYEITMINKKKILFQF